jgi:AraC-like DNA-binding protein
MSINAYVELLKSLQADHLLGVGKQVSMATIAAQLAYRDEQHFIESFTHHIGQSPETFQPASCIPRSFGYMHDIAKIPQMQIGWAITALIKKP